MQRSHHAVINFTGTLADLNDPSKRTLPVGEGFVMHRTRDAYSGKAVSRAMLLEVKTEAVQDLPYAIGFKLVSGETGEYAVNGPYDKFELKSGQLGAETIQKYLFTVDPKEKGSDSSRMLGVDMPLQTMAAIRGRGLDDIRAEISTGTAPDGSQKYGVPFTSPVTGYISAHPQDFGPLSGYRTYNNQLILDQATHNLALAQIDSRILKQLVHVNPADLRLVACRIGDDAGKRWDDIGAESRGNTELEAAEQEVMHSIHGRISLTYADATEVGKRAVVAGSSPSMPSGWADAANGQGQF